jgi:hypothetical protein
MKILYFLEMIKVNKNRTLAKLSQLSCLNTEITKRKLLTPTYVPLFICLSVHLFFCLSVCLLENLFPYEYSLNLADMINLRFP